MNGRRSIAMLTLLGLLAACGGGSVGNATVAVKDVDSDVATTSTLTAGVCSGITVKSDDVTVNITTYPQTSPPKGAPPQIVIDSVAINFIPKNTNYPPLPSQPAELIGTRIPYGSTAPVTFQLVSLALKNSSELSSLRCTSITFSYFVTLTFTAHDQNSGVSVPIDPAQLNVNFADFVG